MEQIYQFYNFTMPGYDHSIFNHNPGKQSSVLLHWIWLNGKWYIHSFQLKDNKIIQFELELLFLS